MVLSESALTVEEAGLRYVDPLAYGDWDGWHQAAKVLRERDPIHLVEHADFNPFYVLTKHRDVWEAEHHHEVFRNEPNPVLGPKEAEIFAAQNGGLLRTLIHMDDPDHRVHRDLTMDWFKPRSLRRLEGQLELLAKQAADRMIELGGECDFATDIAMPYPLQVILSILGLPEEDYPRMLKLTQEIFGASDSDLSRGEPGDLAALLPTIQEFFMYFNALTEDRKANPTEDLATVIANAEINGQPIGMAEQVSYYVIIATAGHDTTSSSMSGGMQALIENPDQLQRLRDDPSLLNTAADEIIRWVSPVRHFMRQLAAPYELSGHAFEKDDRVLLSYPSANRDEDEFADPFTFDVGRTPNRHLAFGFGVHYCLGAMLAKMEIKALFRELIPRIKSIELAGEPQYTRTHFVGGHKRLPIRYEIA